MNIERLQELVDKRPGLSIVGDEIVHLYELNGQERKVSLKTDVLLNPSEELNEKDLEEVIKEVLETMLMSRQHEIEHQQLTFQQQIIRMASRYAYMRDVLFYGAKKGEFPEPLHTIFERKEIKYPTAEDLDEALDELMKD